VERGVRCDTRGRAARGSSCVSGSAAPRRARSLTSVPAPPGVSRGARHRGSPSSAHRRLDSTVPARGRSLPWERRACLIASFRVASCRQPSSAHDAQSFGQSRTLRINSVSASLAPWLISISPLPVTHSVLPAIFMSFRGPTGPAPRVGSSPLPRKGSQMIDRSCSAKSGTRILGSIEDPVERRSII
jgi:hypothetical protein